MIVNNFSSFRGIFGAGQPPDVTGYETWPIASLRASGFGGAVRMLAPPPAALTWPIDVTANNGALDAVAGVDEYDWYIYQRTDDPTLQYLLISQVVNHSGSFRFQLNTSNAAKLLPGVAPPIVDTDSLIKLFKNVAAYCRRRSDGAIDYLNLLTQLVPNQ